MLHVLQLLLQLEEKEEKLKMGMIPVILAQDVDAVANSVELVGVDVSLEGIAFVILVGVALFAWCLVKPRVGRIVARVLAVVAVGTGVGALTWGICAATFGDPVRAMSALPGFLAAPGDAIGLGAGLLAAGIMALVLSFIGGEQPDADESNVAD